MMLETGLARLDQLIDELSDPRKPQCDLLREHLEAARIYCLGDMPAEYQLNLRLAIESLDCIQDPARRHRMKQTLSELASL